MLTTKVPFLWLSLPSSMRTPINVYYDYYLCLWPVNTCVIMTTTCIYGPHCLCAWCQPHVSKMTTTFIYDDHYLRPWGPLVTRSHGIWDNQIYIELFLAVCDNSAGMFFGKNTFFAVNGSKSGCVEARIILVFAFDRSDPWQTVHIFSTVHREQSQPDVK